MLRLVTYSTPSHAAMCERFVLSRAWGFDDRMHTSYDQTCETGAFKSAGWNACMLDKLRTLLAVPVDNNPTLYVDADVALFPHLVQWCRWRQTFLEPDEIAFSDDVVQWCAGIMLFRSTRRVHEFWRTIADLSAAWDLPDQEVIHELRQHTASRNGTFPIKASVLPRDVFCNWATVNAPTVPPPWTGESFDIPKTCLAWHANWVVGVDGKLEMLSRVVTQETRRAEPVAS